MRLSDITLAVPDELHKLAGVESPDEQQLEQDFASLAFLFIQDRAAKLMPHMLGFEIVEQEEDGSQAVGIFGFKVGDDYYYVPAFFVNQQVKGMDLLFSRKGNKFMPLTPEYMDKVLDRQALRLGTGVEGTNQLREDFSSPDFDFARTPPGGMKHATAGWTPGDGHTAWNDIQESAIDAYRSDPEFRRDFAASLSKAAGAGLEGVEQGSSLCDFLRNTGGPQLVAGLMGLLGSNTKYASAALDLYGGIEDFKISEFDASLAPVEKVAEVRITTDPSGVGDVDEKKRLVTHGVAVVDNRKDENKSTLYDVDCVTQFSNPDRGGRYEVLLSNGSTIEADVLLSSGADGGAVVLSDDHDLFFTADVGAVFVRGDRLADVDKAYESAVDTDKLKPGVRYLLLDNEGRSSGLFGVRTAVAESHPSDADKTSYRVWFDKGVQHRARNFTASESFDHLYSNVDIGELKKLRLVEDGGRRLRVKGDALVVPSEGWKALELPDAFSASSDGFEPGSPLDFEEALYKHSVHEIGVQAEDQGSTFYIGLAGDLAGPFGVKEAIHQLVCRYGLSAADADSTMKEASVASFGKCRKLIKFAQLAGVGMPAPDYDPHTGVDAHTGMPMTGSQSETVQGEMLGLNEIPDSAALGHASGGQAESELAQLAEEAAASGQRHVFDHATIGGLARMYDTSAALDQYIPEMTKSLDRIGRILFMFYWKNEAFEERYGAADIVDIEDTLRSVFKSFGRLIRLLEQKSIASADGEDLAIA